MLRSLRNPFGPTRTRSQAEADVLNDMHRALQAMTMLRTGQGLDFNISSYGATLSLNLPKPVFARIVDKTNTSSNNHLTLYSALPVIEAFENVTAGTKPLGEDQSHSSLLDAYELSNNRDVPVDGSVYVWLYPPMAGGHWYFTYDQEIIFAEIECQEDDPGSGSAGSGAVEGVTDCGAGAGFGTGTGPGAAKYAWHQVIPQENGLFATPSAGGYSGTIQVNPLYELNGNRRVMEGTVVRAWRGWTRGRAWVQTIPINRGNGSSVREKQRLFIRNACSGTFTLTVYDAEGDSATTAAIAYDATAAEIEAAIEGLGLGSGSGSAGINVTVTPLSGTTFDITFDDDFATHQIIEPNFAELESCQEWLFDSGDGNTADDSNNNITYRYRCEDGLLREYAIDPVSQVETFNRVIACCDDTACAGSGSIGSGDGEGNTCCCPSDTIPDELCFNDLGQNIAVKLTNNGFDQWIGTYDTGSTIPLTLSLQCLDLDFFDDPVIYNQCGQAFNDPCVFRLVVSGGGQGGSTTSYLCDPTCSPFSASVPGIISFFSNSPTSGPYSITEAVGGLCPDPGSGSGSGSAAGIETDCCEDTIPETLTLTITDKTGNLTCLPDTITLTHEGALGPQQWSAASDSRFNDGDAGALNIYCHNGVWKWTPVQLTGACAAGLTLTTVDAASAEADSGTCNPLEIVFSLDAHEGTATGTVTE